MLLLYLRHHLDLHYLKLLRHLYLRHRQLGIFLQVESFHQSYLHHPFQNRQLKNLHHFDHHRRPIHHLIRRQLVVHLNRRHHHRYTKLL